MMVFLKKPDAPAEKAIRGSKAIVLLPVTAKWYLSVVALNLLQKHWEWQEHRKEASLHSAQKYKTMYLASLDVKTAFGVAKPGVMAEILKETGVHRWINAALLEEMKDLMGKNELQIQRDSVQIRRMRQTRTCGGTDAVHEAGEVHFVERGGKVQSSRCRVVRWRGRQQVVVIFTPFVGS